MARDTKRHYLIKNLHETGFEPHFFWSAFNVMIFLALWLCGVAFAGIALSGNGVPMNSAAFMYVGPALALPLLFLAGTFWARRWEVGFVIFFVSTGGIGALLGLANVPPLTIGVFIGMYTLACIASTMLQMTREWERAVVLRLGRFRAVRGPGLYLILPFFDTIAEVIDIRTRVTDFKAETTLTSDSVPITVDALCFWLVWDAGKAKLEVENYLDAVVLSAQTALRSAISANTLTSLLARDERIKEEIRSAVDSKTTDWGITIQHIEITEIIIPQELQDSMSHTAQAEREKKARILLAEAEEEIAEALGKAAEHYRTNSEAYGLRKLSILLEGFKNGSAMVMVPSDMGQALSDEDVFGLKALQEVRAKKAPDTAK